MIATTVPAEARFVADNIRDLVPDLKYKTLCAVVSLFLLGKKTLYQGVREMTFAPSVSTMSRTMTAFNPSRLMRRIRKSVLRKHGMMNPKEWIFVIDDTANPKYGNPIHTGYWGSSSGVYYGQKIMVLALVNLKTKKCIPLDYTILPKRSSKKAPKATWHAVRMIASAIAGGFPPLTLVCDSWFDSISLMANLLKYDVQMVVQIKANRLVKTNPGPNVAWQRLDEAFKDEKRYRSKTDWDSKKVRERRKKGMVLSEKVVQLKNRKTPVKIVAAYDRRNGKNAYGYFASTDVSMPRAQVWRLCRARWAIEKMFRTLKQSLSFGKLTLKEKQAAHLAVAMPLFLYAKLVDRCPDSMSIDQFISKIQNDAARSGIFKITTSIDPRPANTLRARLASNRAHKKPVDKPAGIGKMAA